jgi:hypothetical protein
MGQVPARSEPNPLCLRHIGYWYRLPETGHHYPINSHFDLELAQTAKA